MSLQFLSIDDAATVGAGLAVPMSQCQNAKEITWYVIFAPGVTVGVVRIETAHRDDYGGLWSQVVQVDAAVVGGGAVAHGFIYKRVASLRGRITTQITGGGDPGVTVIFVLPGDI